MNTHSLPYGLYTVRFSVLFFILVVCLLALLPTSAQATDATSTPETAPTTMEFLIEKKLSGPYPESMTADQFTFAIEGIADPVSVVAGTDDYASALVELPVGVFSIEEIGPTGFVAEDWTIQWSGAGCQNEGNAIGTTLTIEESDLDKTNFGCRADNQYRPINEPSASGTLLVTKEVVGTSTAANRFSFRYALDGGAFGRTIAFETDNTNEIEIPPGTYEVEEVSATGYVISYSDTCSGEMRGGETVECVITNTWVSESDVLGCTDETANNHNPLATIDDGSCTYGGGGGDDTDTFIIEGYVWHDANENALWEGFSDANEEDETASTTPEDSLQGWTVRITNGETTFATTTDATGYYFFEVPAGTWTITEELQDGWKLITPQSASFVVTVPEVVAESFVDRVFAMFVPTAHAAVVGTFGPFNFGNNQSTTGGGGNNPPPTPTPSSSSRGGGSSSPRCDAFDLTEDTGFASLRWETRRGTDLTITENGREIFATDDRDTVAAGVIAVTPSGDTTYELTVSRGSRSDTCSIATDQPSGQVLGDQVAIVPLGAADAGGGGMAPLSTSIPYTLLGALLILFGVRRIMHGV